MKEFITKTNCPKCEKKSFKITSHEKKDQLTVKGLCSSCKHKNEKTAVIFKDDTYLENKKYLKSYFIKSFYLKENEEIALCPECDDGFYIITKLKNKTKMAIHGICNTCGFTKMSLRTTGTKPSNREMMNFVLDIDENISIEYNNNKDKNNDNDYFEF
jgi:transcription elongation factor Elf1